MIVRRCDMIPIEVVMRRMATGSYVKRHPEIAEGARFEPPLVEFFLKDDARHDPQITAEEMAAQGIAIEGRTKWSRGGESVYFRDPDGHLLELATPGLWAIY